VSLVPAGYFRTPLWKKLGIGAASMRGQKPLELSKAAKGANFLGYGIGGLPFSSSTC
jgi:hypothetical protein